MILQSQRELEEARQKENSKSYSADSTSQLLGYWKLNSMKYSSQHLSLTLHSLETIQKQYTYQAVSTAHNIKNATLFLIGSVVTTKIGIFQNCYYCNLESALFITLSYGILLLQFSEAQLHTM